MKDGFGLESTAYEGEMTKEVAPTSFKLYDACSSLSPHAQVID